MTTFTRLDIKDTLVNIPHHIKQMIFEFPHQILCIFQPCIVEVFSLLCGFCSKRGGPLILLLYFFPSLIISCFRSEKDRHYFSKTHFRAEKKCGQLYSGLSYLISESKGKPLSLCGCAIIIVFTMITYEMLKLKSLFSL